MGKGLIPADLDTWKQRRRGEQVVVYNRTLHLNLKQNKNEKNKIKIEVTGCPFLTNDGWHL